MADHDVKVLNSLITTTIDSANGFERSAENADAARFETLFRDMGRERREVVMKLQEQVRGLGGTPSDDGSLKADVHRRWEDMRNALSGKSDKAIVEEVERGEDYIKDKFETAMEDKELSEGTRAVIAGAYQSIRKGHDRASELKHSMQATT